MANVNLQWTDLESNDSSENQSSDEWMMVDRLPQKDDTDEDVAGAEDICDGPEVPRGLEILESDTNKEQPKCNDNDTEKHNDDSDGISVITDSDNEQLILNKRVGEISSDNPPMCGIVQKYEKTGKRTASQVGTVLNVVLACSLAALMGLGAGRILDMYDKCSVSNDADFSTIKTESDMLIRQMKELSEVKEVLDDTKAGIPKVEWSEEHESQRGSESRLKRSRRAEKLSDSYVVDPDTTVLEQLHLSLSTLYSVIDGINRNENTTNSDVSRERNVMTDLLEFKKILNNVVTELDSIRDPNEIAFLRHADKKIKDISKSLLNNLSFTIRGLTMNIHHKLEKVRHKLNKRLCMLTNTESNEPNFFETFAENNSFLESCGKALNLSFKSKNVDSAKIKKQKEADRRFGQQAASHQKEKLLDKFSSEFKLKDSKHSTHDHSIPEMVYIADKNFWNKLPLVEMQATSVDMKILPDDKIPSNVENKACTESNNSQCSRNVVTMKSLNVENLPAIENSARQTDNIDEEMIRAKTPEIPMKYPKPLYSTVLKKKQDDSINVPNHMNTPKTLRKHEKSTAYSNEDCREGQACLQKKFRSTEGHESQKKGEIRFKESDIKSQVKAAKKNEKLKYENKKMIGKSGKKLKNESKYRKKNDDATGEWQIQRSQAREGHRDHDRRSEWLFDRANSRQSARDEIGPKCNAPYCQSAKYRALSEDENIDDDFDDYWHEMKDINSRRYANSRAGSTAKKIKLTREKNIRQIRHA